MFHRLKITLLMTLLAGLAVGCSPATFSGQDAEQKANALNTNNPSLQGLDDSADVILAQPPSGGGAGACNFPAYTGPYNSPQNSECHSQSFSYASPVGLNVASGRTIRFRMYNASNLSHGLVPSTHRFIATQKISLAPGLAAQSIDLVLSSYEPVIWKIIGNSAAVRSVHVDGYHCAKVEGVDAGRVRIQTYEQGVIEPTNPLPLSSQIASDQSVYEGSCLADNTLFVQ